MTEAQREKMLKVGGPRPRELGPILCEFYRYPNFEQIFDWLIEQRLTGAALQRWIIEKHKGSTKLAAAYISLGAP